MTAPEEPDTAPSRRSRLGLGAAIVVVLVALAVTVGVGILRGAAAPIETVRVDGSATDAPSLPAVYVHVSGAVVAPGLYVLHGSARVVDAVAAAGGFAPDADESAVNLARVLGDGEQLVVPVVGAEAAAGVAVTADGSAQAGATGGGATVNLNTADAAALDTLPRIGPAMAARIIQWREDNGRFTSVEDLLAVPGIGDKMLDSLRELVSI